VIRDETKLREILRQTALADSPVARLNIRDPDEIAFAIDIPLAEPMQSWQLMRELVPQTGRWPVLITLWGGGNSWHEKARLIRDEFSNRFAFTQELLKDSRSGHNPADIIAASETVDVGAQLRQIEERMQSAHYEHFDLEEDLERLLEGTRDRFGFAPDVGDPVNFLTTEKIYSKASLERWLFEWERKNCADALRVQDDELSYLEWFEQHSPSLVLLLMPSARHWEIPAYLNWFASNIASSQLIVALLREWHQKYGAELVSHHGTMLELITSRLPDTPEDAFHLAWQQETIAQCTTIPAGVSLRDHARAMLCTNCWFLHARR